MYTTIDISKLPSKGIFYKKDVHIETRPLEKFEIDKINKIKKNSFLDQLRKLEISLTVIVTNMDEFDICYVDAFYIFYITLGLTYKEIAVNYKDIKIKTKIDSNNFEYFKPDFKSLQDIYFKKCDIQFYYPNMYNMLKANQNVITEGLKDENLVKDTIMLTRMSLVPYLQKNKISDDALFYINEHISQFNKKEILEMRDFLDSNINYITGQSLSVEYNNEIIETTIDLNSLV